MGDRKRPSIVIWIIPLLVGIVGFQRVTQSPNFEMYRAVDIVQLLGYAGGHEQAVRITTTDRTEVIGVPMSVDTHITAHEVYLRPAGQGDTEIAVSLGAIEAVELV